MRNRLFTFSNMLLSGLISLLGFGSCHSFHQEKVECVYGPPPEEYYQEEAEQEDTLYESAPDSVPSSTIGINPINGERNPNR